MPIKNGHSWRHVTALKMGKMPIFNLHGSGVTGKQHDTPQNKKEDCGMEKESERRGTATAVGDRDNPSEQLLRHSERFRVGD